jgi:hypothetical protein
MKNIVENLNIQANIGSKMNNANGKLLARIANMCSWMEPNDFDLPVIKPLVGEKAKREHMLLGEALMRMGI